MSVIGLILVEMPVSTSDTTGRLERAYRDTFDCDASWILPGHPSSVHFIRMNSRIFGWGCLSVVMVNHSRFPSGFSAHNLKTTYSGLLDHLWYRN